MEVIERLPFSYLPGNEQTVLTLKVSIVRLQL